VTAGKPLNIWHVSREMAPFAEAGGIKDVVAGLCRALVEADQLVTVVLPMYQFLQHYQENKPLFEFSLDFENYCQTVRVYSIYYYKIRILFISASCFTSKEQVYTYSMNEESINGDYVYGSGHDDCHFMNLVLQRSALESALRLNVKPDIFRLHDGHCGFLPAIMRSDKRYNSYFFKTSSLLTIHNGGIVYQQNIADREEARILTGLPLSVLDDFKLEYGYSPILCSGKYGYLNTVSEQYANDIISGSDQNSGILGGALEENGIELTGITNGIDIELHKNSLYADLPKPDPLSKDLLWKNEYKTFLFNNISAMGHNNSIYGSLIEDPLLPLVTMQSRITYQKGVDIVLDGIRRVLESGRKINVLIVGEGETGYEERLAELAEGTINFCYIRKYDLKLSHQLFAAGDFFLIPSRWEPCGLTDFIAQLYGNIPIVHETGGLKKTVNLKNGFSYKENNGGSLFDKICETTEMYSRKSHLLFEIRKNAVNIINEKYTWEKVLAKGYIPLYRKISER